MSVIVATLLCGAFYFLGLRFYGRFLGRRVFALRDDVVTPAHRFNDGVDYVPTQKPILFGHHYASIAGLAPMLGPAVAVIWGWLPAMVWVVLGAIVIGCVHDLGAMVVSLRGRGMSIGHVAEGILGPRAKLLFLLIIFFGVALAMGVFVFVIGRLFSLEVAPGVAGYPSAVTPSAGLMVVALVMGYLLYRKGVSLGLLAPVAFIISLGLVTLGHTVPTMGIPDALWPRPNTWIFILLAYAFLASVLPVWVLLQARDFVNSLLLYLGLTAAYVGMFVLAPNFAAPAVRLEVEGAPDILPFVFIIIACGAASGFHGLVSSGTTAKQIDKETDAVGIGYGGMVGESALGLLAVLATTAGIASPEVWESRYANWGAAQGLAANISSFIDGCATFIAGLGVPFDFAASFVAVVVVSFALTTLDSATRLLRYNIEELGAALKLGGWLQNRYVSSLAAVVVIAGFAFYEVGGKPAALALWTLFGTTNQLLAGLTLLAVTVYLKQRQKPVWYTGVPAVFMLGSTLVAMTQNLMEFAAQEPRQMVLLGVGGVLWVLGVWIVVEGVLVLRRGSRVESLEIALPQNDAGQSALEAVKQV